MSPCLSTRAFRDRLTGMAYRAKGSTSSSSFVLGTFLAEKHLVMAPKTSLFSTHFIVKAIFTTQRLSVFRLKISLSCPRPLYND